MTKTLHSKSVPDHFITGRRECDSEGVDPRVPTLISRVTRDETVDLREFALDIEKVASSRDE